MYEKGIQYLEKHYQEGLDHSIEVMHILLQNGYSQEIQLVGLMLKAIEVKAIHPSIIENIFGSSVLEITQRLHKGTQISWIDRRTDIIEMLKNTKSIDILAIYFADALTTLRNLYRTLEYKGIRAVMNINISINNLMWYLRQIYELSGCFIDKQMYYEYEKTFLTMVSVGKGINTSIDEEIIKTYFQKACELEEYGPKDSYLKVQKFQYLADRYEDQESQNMVGLYYESGSGVKKNIEKAVYYFQEGTRNGNMDSPYHLAKYYINGIIVKKNLNTAKELLSEAIKRGCDLAKDQLEYLEMARQANADYVVVTDIDEFLNKEMK